MRLLIIVDTNDADYHTTLEDNCSEQTAEVVRRVAAAIKKFQPYEVDTTWGKSKFNHNFPVGEYGCRPDMGEKTTTQLYVETGLVTQEELEQFISLCPYEEGGFHTVKAIEIDHISLL